MNTDNTLDRIDDTLTFYSTGLDTDLVAAKDAPEWPTALTPAVRAQFTDAFNVIADVLVQFGQAVVEATTAVGAAMRPFLAAMAPLAEAMKRRDRWQKVLHRWNEPAMRATMWDRKSARTSRAWTTRQVD